MPETSPPPFLSLQDFATAAGRYRWFEQRLFEVLGGWVAVEPDAEARLAFHTHSFHAAWHADLWAGLVPLLPDRPLESVTRPANAELVSFVDHLGTFSDEGRSAERLTAAYRIVLPALLTAYDAHERAANPVCDGPVIRVLGLLRHDLRRDLAVGEALVGARSGASEDLAGFEASLRERLRVAGDLRPGLPTT